MAGPRGFARLARAIGHSTLACPSPCGPLAPPAPAPDRESTFLFDPLPANVTPPRRPVSRGRGTGRGDEPVPATPTLSAHPDPKGVRDDRRPGEVTRVRVAR